MNALKIDETVYRQARMRAISEDLPLNQILENLLRVYLKHGFDLWPPPAPGLGCIISRTNMPDATVEIDAKGNTIDRAVPAGAPERI